MIQIVRYQQEDGTEPYTDWLRKLRDGVARIAVAMRLRHLESGNFGDCSPVGEGVSELRIHTGPGYRIYFGRQGNLLVILLTGGNKSSQASDIARAKSLWAEWKRRQP